MFPSIFVSYVPEVSVFQDQYIYFVFCNLLNFFIDKHLH